MSMFSVLVMVIGREAEVVSTVIKIAGLLYQLAGASAASTGKPLVRSKNNKSNRLNVNNQNIEFLFNTLSSVSVYGTVPSSARPNYVRSTMRRQGRYATARRCNTYLS